MILKIIWLNNLLITATILVSGQDLSSMDVKKDIVILPATSQDNEYLENKLVEFNQQQAPFTQSEPFIQLNYFLSVRSLAMTLSAAPTPLPLLNSQVAGILSPSNPIFIDLPFT